MTAAGFSDTERKLISVLDENSVIQFKLKEDLSEFDSIACPFEPIGPWVCFDDEYMKHYEKNLDRDFLSSVHGYDGHFLRFFRDASDYQLTAFGLD